MDILKGIVETVLTTAIWAFVVYRLAVTALNRFEDRFANALGRLKKFGPAEFEQLPPAQSQEATKSLEPAAPPKSVAAPDTMVGRFETPIVEWVNLLKPDERQADLIRSLAIWQISWSFETINYSILGSQLQLLGALNSQQLTMQQVKAYYDVAASSAPEYYKSHPFENWFGWLAATIKLVSVAGNFVAITEDGREFIKYVVTRGYPLSRFG